MLSVLNNIKIQEKKDDIKKAHTYNYGAEELE
jgi:hypothetical protein